MEKYLNYLLQDIRNAHRPADFQGKPVGQTSESPAEAPPSSQSDQAKPTFGHYCGLDSKQLFMTRFNPYSKVDAVGN